MSPRLIKLDLVRWTIRLPEHGGDLRRERPQRLFFEGKADGSTVAIGRNDHMDGLSCEGAGSASQFLSKDRHGFVRSDDLSGARHKLFGGVERLRGRQQEAVKLVGWIAGGRVINEYAHQMLSAFDEWHKRVRQLGDHVASSVGRI